MKRPNPYLLPGTESLTRHQSTPQVTLGHGALSQLGTLSGGRLALVLDTYLLGTDFFRTLTEKTLAGCDFQVICDVKEEPSFAAIDPFIPVLQAYAPTHIVAIGGGSTIDTAKALWAFYEHPEFDWNRLTSAPIPPFSGKATLVAVPTTSGTGAEATGAAVYKKYDGTKALLIDDAIRPGEVFLDFDLLSSLPKKVIANAGVDALAHVLGALSMSSINLLDRMLCTQTAVKILQALPHSYLEGDTLSRDTMHICAYLAGDEINNAGGGLEHKLDMFAKAYHIPHGEMIGIFLPYTMLYLLPENHYLEVAEQLGVQGNTPEEKQRNLVRRIWSMYDILNMPKTIQDAGVPEEAFLEKLPDYIDMVKNIGHIYWIKGFLGDESLRELYLRAYYGMEGDI